MSRHLNDLRMYKCIFSVTVSGLGDISRLVTRRVGPSQSDGEAVPVEFNPL